MIEGAIHQRNIEQCCWMSPLVWCWYVCKTQSERSSTIQSRLKNNGFDSKTEGSKETRQDKDTKTIILGQSMANGANSACTVITHKPWLHSGGITKNTLLLWCIQNSWSECRGISMCSYVRRVRVRLYFYKLPSRGHLNLLHKVNSCIGWLNQQCCFKANMKDVFYF